MDTINDIFSKINSTVKELQTLTQDERRRSFGILNNDILRIMRKETGSWFLL
jgi:hypothetical protein